MALWGNTDALISVPKHLGNGQIIKVNVTTPGSGYTVSTTAAMTLSAPPAGGVQATVTADTTGGSVNSVTITNPGSGYTSPPTVTAGPAGGTGATFVPVIHVITKVAVGSSAIPRSVIFVDSTEALLAQNRAKGLRSPGWWHYMEYIQNDGATRYKVSNIIAMDRTVAQAGDNNVDDVIVADTTFVISTQPVNATTVSGAATFAVVATGATAYQWQVRSATGGQYTSLTNTGVYTGVTTATLALTGAGVGLTGNKYRCQVANTGAGAAATTVGATLTFGT